MRGDVMMVLYLWVSTNSAILLQKSKVYSLWPQWMSKWWIALFQPRGLQNTLKASFIPSLLFVFVLWVGNGHYFCLFLWIWLWDGNISILTIQNKIVSNLLKYLLVISFRHEKVQTFTFLSWKIYATYFVFNIKLSYGFDELCFYARNYLIEL